MTDLPRIKPLVVLASLAIAAVAVGLLVLSDLPVVPARADLARLSAIHVVASVLLLALAFFARAARWRWLLRPVALAPWREVLAVNWVFYGANLILPLRTGELVRPVIFSRRGHGTLVENLGVVVSERIIDAVFASAVLIFGLALLPPGADHGAKVGDLPVSVHHIWSAAVSIAAVAGAASVFLLGFRAFRHVLLRQVARLPAKLASPVQTHLARLAESLAFLGRLDLLIPFLAATGVYWIASVLSVLILLWGAGIGDANLVTAATVCGVMVFGLLAPNAPAQVGVYQLVTYTALIICFPLAIVRLEGAIFTFAVYLIQALIILTGTLIGGLYLLRSPHNRTEN